MGTQQILRAAAALVLIAGVAHADRGPRRASHERIAIVDLGPADDGAARRVLGTAAVAAGLDVVLGDGLDDALAGISSAADDAVLAVAMTQAKQAFGELDCKHATSEAEHAIGLLAARQAAGLPVHELPRAWTYVLLCADRTGDTDKALLAAARLREAGGAAEVSPALLAKYPDVDVVAGIDLVALDVTADVPGAAVWVDFQDAGTSPVHLSLPAGPHVIAAASGTRRGFIAGSAVKSQKTVTIAMPDQAGAHTALAERVAGWHGKLPAPTELAAVLADVHARLALVRHGDTVEVWGHAGLAEPLRRLGGVDGTRSLAEADRAVALIVDRVQTWNDRAPDPDQPLLTESQEERASHRAGASEAPTKWWVYLVIGAAVAGGAALIVSHESSGDTQRVELHYP